MIGRTLKLFFVLIMIYAAFAVSPYMGVAMMVILILGRLKK